METIGEGKNRLTRDSINLFSPDSGMAGDLSFCSLHQKSDAHVYAEFSGV